MARKPTSFQWLGFTDEQVQLLDFLDHVGNNGWARNSQTEAIMANVLRDCADAGLGLDRIIDAMRSIGYSRMPCTNSSAGRASGLPGSSVGGISIELRHGQTL